jgi:hypothetical protein
VPADIERPRPAIAWSWQPDHGGRVDQVRVSGTAVVVATMSPRDPTAPGWEHAVVYALEARSGVEIARRVLPDPVPVAAMVIDAGIVHIVATRRGEPIYWYALSGDDLRPHHRRVSPAEAAHHDDVLDAWATTDGGLWFELDVPFSEGGSGAPDPGDGSGALFRDPGFGRRSSTPPSSVEWSRSQTYAFADATGATSVRLRDECAGTEGPPMAHDACAGGRELFVPGDGRWEGVVEPAPPVISRLDPRSDGGSRDETLWASASIMGPRARMHALGGEGCVYGVASAEDPAKPDRLRVEAFAVERASNTVVWRAYDDRIAAAASLGGAARTARRPNGELLFQRFGQDGMPQTPLICARPDGRLDTVLLGARGRYVLDAALGSLVLAHRENRSGNVEVGGFAVDREGRLLGRRAVAIWTLDVGDLGGGATVYAGAGLVVVRGSREVRAVRL